MFWHEIFLWDMSWPAFYNILFLILPLFLECLVVPFFLLFSLMKYCQADAPAARTGSKTCTSECKERRADKYCADGCRSLPQRMWPAGSNGADRAAGQYRFRWRWGICFVVLCAAERVVRLYWRDSSAGGLLSEILLLAVCGRVLSGQDWQQLFTASALIVSIESICDGITQWLLYWLLTLAGAALPRSADLILKIMKLLLVAAFLILIRRFFRQDIREGIFVSGENQQGLWILAIPVFFISLVEWTVRDAVYGNTLVLDTKQGLVAPVVDHGEILFLQATAVVCLFLTLAGFQKWRKVSSAEQRVQCLEQQAKMQEIYVKEALLRYGRTRSFRHDIQNHLAVLAELLRTEKNQEARVYLEHLEQAAGSMSFPAYTGNVSVDALLGSKFSAAEQKQISVRCEMKIPESSGISDMDWCIILANAVDNAVTAGEAVSKEKRYLYITGRKKGNFYLLSVENPCEGTAKKPVREGIGLSNIRAVAKKYQGTVRVERSEEVFRLELLLVLRTEK